MFSSLRARLVLFISLVVLASLLITSGLFYQFMSSYARREKETALRKQGSVIAKQIEQIGLPQAKRISNFNEGLTGTRVYFVNRNGQLMGLSGFAEAPGRAVQQALSVPLDKPASFERYMPGSGRTMLFVSVPVNGKTDIGAVVLATPLSDIRQAQLPFFYLFLVAAGVSFLLAIAAALAIAASITKPIRALTGAAEKVAHGDLTPVVETRADDEVGRLTRSFNFMVEKLRRTYEAQKAFASNISHEFRTPLTSIEGYSKALLDDVPPDEAARTRSIEIINEESQRLKRLTESMLLLARIDADVLEPNTSTIKAGQFLERIKEKYLPQLEKTKRGMNIDIAAGAGEFVADPDYLEQVLMNLLDNALRYAPEGSSVNVSVTRQERNNLPSQILLSVADSGPGIPADKLDKIFDRFYSPSKDSSPGAGLGLAIAKDMVEKLGGDLSAQSEPGQGTTFTIVLPG